MRCRSRHCGTSALRSDSNPVGHDLHTRGARNDAPWTVFTFAVIQRYVLTKRPRKAVLDWQKEFQDQLGDEAERYGGSFNVVYLTGRSTPDALAASVSGELFLVFTTCGFTAGGVLRATPRYRDET